MHSYLESRRLIEGLATQLAQKRARDQVDALVMTQVLLALEALVAHFTREVLLRPEANEIYYIDNYILNTVKLSTFFKNNFWLKHIMQISHGHNYYYYRAACLDRPPLLYKAACQDRWSVISGWI